MVETNEQVRNYLLHARAWRWCRSNVGMRAETGWMRLSVGAVSIDDVTKLPPRLREALFAVA